MKYTLLFLLLGSFTLFSDEMQVIALPGWGNIENRQMAGHLPVREHEEAYSSDQNLFYWFVLKDHEAPIVLWLNGGPGASSFYGFFTENGPYVIEKNLTLGSREFALSEKVSYLMIDEPPGVGYSYAKEGTHLKNEAEAIDMLHQGLVAFFKKNPELIKNPLYLAGESYAGKYLAELGMRMLSSHDPLNLKGILVGDGWVDPLTQQSTDADFAHSHGLIDQADYEHARELFKKCEKDSSMCDDIENFIHEKSGVDPHDIRTTHEQDYSLISKYLNQKEVRGALHVDPRVKEFVLFNERVSKDLEKEIEKSAAYLYPQLLQKGIRILFYNGLEDGTDSNFMGEEKWLTALKWEGSEEFKNAPTTTWYYREDVAGYIKTARGLTFVKVRKAGHMAPMDQPGPIQDLIARFILESAN